MVEIERVRLLVDGVERAIAEYQNKPAPSVADGAKTLGQVLGLLNLYSERFESTQ